MRLLWFSMGFVFISHETPLNSHKNYDLNAFMVSRMDEKTVQELQQELVKLKKAQARIKRKFTAMLSIIAMLVLVTATLAWFTLSNFASVNEINLKISTAPELYLDIENRGTDTSLWKKTLTNDMINTSLRAQNAPTLDQQLLDPVTSSNGITFQNQSGSSRPRRCMFTFPARRFRSRTRMPPPPAPPPIPAVKRISSARFVCPLRITVPPRSGSRTRVLP